MNRCLTCDKNIDKIILSHLDITDLINICLTCKYTNLLFNDELFWKQKFIQQYGLLLTNVKSNRSWKSFYLNIYHNMNKLKGLYFAHDEEKMYQRIFEKIAEKAENKDLIISLVYLLQVNWTSVSEGLRKGANKSNDESFIEFISKRTKSILYL